MVAGARILIRFALLDRDLLVAPTAATFGQCTDGCVQPVQYFSFLLATGPDAFVFEAIP